MKHVVFIGHRDCYGLSASQIETAIRACICQGSTEFYSGGQGAFDRLCARCVFELKKEFPQIRNILVIPYLSFSVFNPALFDDILFPEELEQLPFKAAIPRRNQYMVKQASVAVCYITHTWGNAFKTYTLAQKKGMKIINLTRLS
ncbi:MAG: DUF1273 domain-containing protein [Clostridia bacterium]|nr:DUF1273 domain-containing protein [Clostridia bacterium]